MINIMKQYNYVIKIILNNKPKSSRITTWLCTEQHSHAKKILLSYA